MKKDLTMHMRIDEDTKKFLLKLGKGNISGATQKCINIIKIAESYNMGESDIYKALANYSKK